ncbi:MAG: RNA 2'-phosphotransferase [Desulfuromonadales bacterium]
MPKTKLSKFLSLVLRHQPDAIGLNLDSAGWADITELIEKARKAGVNLTPAAIQNVVATSDKQRFRISPDGTRIRANHGHSLPVELGLPEAEPPDVLYHGTAKRNLASIRREGIRRGKRNHVHLSADKDSAVKVGVRHGQPVVLIVLAAKMHRDGIRFFYSENGVWLTEYVAPEYLLLLSDSQKSGVVCNRTYF